MFVNHISPEQMKQILQRSILSRIIQPLDQQPKKRKVKKRNLSEISKNGINGQSNDQSQSQSSCSQHIKSQDVSLIKCKPDQQEDNIIKVYSDSPNTLNQQILTLKDHNEKHDKQEDIMIKSSNTTTSNNQQKKQIKKSKNGDHSSSKKQNTCSNEQDRENQIVQAFNIMQSSPYTDQKYKQKLRSTLRPIIEAKSLEKQNKQRKLQPLKESLNFSTSNTQQTTQGQYISNSFRAIDDKTHSNTSSVASSYKHPLLQLRPRSSSQKTSPTRQIQSGLGLSSKANFTTLQDNISFYTQNTYRNGVQIHSHRSSSQNMSSDEKVLATDYSVLIKNRKLLDEKLYSTQFKPHKQPPSSNINLSLPTQENSYSNENAQDNNGINFYDDANDKNTQKQKLKFYRSNSSRKQNENKLTSIEKIYKRKVSLVIEAFSPTNKKKQPNSPRNKPKKKIASLAPKDIQIRQSQQKNNNDSSLPTIQETSQTHQTQNK